MTARIVAGAAGGQRGNEGKESQRPREPPERQVWPARIPSSESVARPGARVTRTPYQFTRRFVPTAAPGRPLGTEREKVAHSATFSPFGSAGPPEPARRLRLIA